MNYLDGASAGFGSCFFTLKHHVMERCTFTYGDSVTNPDIFGTKNSFYGIFRAILINAKENKQFFNNKNYFTVKDLIDYLLSLRKEMPTEMSNNFDVYIPIQYIEAQVHGEINLFNDVDCFYIDESFKDTEINEQAEGISELYDIKIFWIPERKIHVKDIGDEFWGPIISVLARKIISKFNIADEYINAEIIGRASRDSMLSPDEWADLGNELEVFQYMKYLWRTVVYCGE